MRKFLMLLLSAAVLMLTACGDGRVVAVSSPDNIIEPPPGTWIVRVIDPCGPHAGIDEIIVELSNGLYMAWYNNLGLFLLDDGVYVTTDAQACQFSIVNGEYVE